MSPKEQAAFRLDQGLLDAMRVLKDRKGVPVTTQIEMAVRDWLKREHGVIVKSERKRAVTRKRP